MQCLCPRLSAQTRLSSWFGLGSRRSGRRKILTKLSKLAVAIFRPQALTRIGIFIDCDGVSAAGATKVINWVEKLGRLNIQRAYGNFSGKASAEWAALLASRRLVARHLPNLVTGKNPLFDPRLYNHAKLTDLLAATPSIEMLEVDGTLCARLRAKPGRSG